MTEYKKLIEQARVTRHEERDDVLDWAEDVVELARDLADALEAATAAAIDAEAVWNKGFMRGHITRSKGEAYEIGEAFNPYKKEAPNV